MAEPRCSPHGWTLDTLEKHLASQIAALKETVQEHDDRNQERFRAQKEAVAAALSAADKAVVKAEAASEKRFDSVNEFRAALADQANTLMPRAEYSVKHEALAEKLDLLRARIAAVESGHVGRKEGYGTIAAVTLGAFSILGTIASIVYVSVVVSKHGL